MRDTGYVGCQVNPEQAGKITHDFYITADELQRKIACLCIIDCISSSVDSFWLAPSREGSTGDGTSSFMGSSES